MNNITIFNNSPGCVSIKIIRTIPGEIGNTVQNFQLSPYEDSDKCVDVDLEVGDIITVENEG